MDNLSDKNNLATKKMAKGEVRKLLTRILNGGDIQFTEYAEKRMLERNITASTVLNVLARGVVQEGEEHFFKDDFQWRYRVETQRYRIVVSFEIETEVIVINAIDFTPHLVDDKVIKMKKGEK